MHGFTQTGAAWDPVATRLADRHEVRCPDLAGHGAAAHVGADLWGAARQVGRDGGAGAYVGYSLGGRVALHLALAAPALVRALVLVSATAGIDDPAERDARVAADEALARRIETIGVARFLDEWLAQPMFAALPAAARGGRSTDAAGLASSLRLAGTGTQYPLWDRLHELTMPALVVVGERDEKFRRLGQRLAAGVDGAALAVIPDAGHAVHLEQPEAFLDVVAPWLDEHAAQPPTANPRPSSAP